VGRLMSPAGALSRAEIMTTLLLFFISTPPSGWRATAESERPHGAGVKNRVLLEDEVGGRRVSIGQRLGSLHLRGDAR